MFHFANEVNNYPVLTGGTIGTSIAPGASGAWGSWTQLIAGASVTRKVDFHRTHIINYGTNGVDKRLLVDIGMRPAGATGSEVTIIPRLVGSKASDNAVFNCPGTEYEGPIYIPAGYDVVARGMSNQGTPGTFYVATSLYSDPLYSCPEGVSCEVIGVVDANVQGTDVAANSNFSGAVSGYGSTWTLIGTTSRESKWLDAIPLKYGTDATSTWLAMEVAFGDSSNKTIVLSGGMWGNGFGVQYFKRKFSRTRDRIPAGSSLYCRVVSQSSVNVAVAIWNYY